jgi:hypothetical protein
VYTIQEALNTSEHAGGHGGTTVYDPDAHPHGLVELQFEQAILFYFIYTILFIPFF